jgi:hypothetical protein
MTRFDGTAARQLDLIDYRPPARVRRVAKASTAAVPAGPPYRRPDLRLLKQDVYAEIERRRRRAQIAARHAVETEP